MKTKLFFSYLLFILLLFVVACKPNSGQKRKRIVPSKGLPSELLLVVDNPILKSDLADSLKELTQSPIPGIMQHEDLFRVVRISSSYYTQKYTTMHSKLFVKLDASLNKPMLGVSYNVVAKPQIELSVVAPTLQALRDFISQHKQVLRDYLLDFQLDMRSNELRRKHNGRVDSLLKQSMGYSICVPYELKYVKQQPNFIWAGTNLNEKDLNVVVYSFPWNGEDVFTPDFFVSKRDSVMKVNIPGSTAEQWMQTTQLNGQPIIQTRIKTHFGEKKFMVNGLWEMRKGAFGGSFVSYVQVDSIASMVIVAEGFVYSPSSEKRELLRCVEASVRTLRKNKGL